MKIRKILFLPMLFILNHSFAQTANELLINKTKLLVNGQPKGICNSTQWNLVPRQTALLETNTGRFASLIRSSEIPSDSEASGTLGAIRASRASNLSTSLKNAGFPNRPGPITIAA